MRQIKKRLVEAEKAIEQNEKDIWELKNPAKYKIGQTICTKENKYLITGRWVREEWMEDGWEWRYEIFLEAKGKTQVSEFWLDKHIVK